MRALRVPEREGKRKEIADTRGALGCSAEAASGPIRGSLAASECVSISSASRSPASAFPASASRHTTVPKRHLLPAPPPKVGGGPDALHILLGGLLRPPGLGRPLSCSRVGRRPSALQTEEKRARGEEDSGAGVAAPAELIRLSSSSVSLGKATSTSSPRLSTLPSARVRAVPA